jgi:hypothetical protein
MWGRHWKRWSQASAACQRWVGGWVGGWVGVGAHPFGSLSARWMEKRRGGACGVGGVLAGAAGLPAALLPALPCGLIPPALPCPPPLPPPLCSPSLAVLWCGTLLGRACTLRGALPASSQKCCACWRSGACPTWRAPAGWRPLWRPQLAELDPQGASQPGSQPASQFGSQPCHVGGCAARAARPSCPHLFPRALPSASIQGF